MLLLAAVLVAAPRGSAESEQEAVRALVEQMMDGWAAGNGEAFAAPFTDDADYIIAAFQNTRIQAEPGRGPR